MAPGNRRGDSRDARIRARCGQRSGETRAKLRQGSVRSRRAASDNSRCAPRVYSALRSVPSDHSSTSKTDSSSRPHRVHRSCWPHPSPHLMLCACVCSMCGPDWYGRPAGRTNGPAFGVLGGRFSQWPFVAFDETCLLLSGGSCANQYTTIQLQH